MSKHVPAFDLFPDHYPRTERRRAHTERLSAFWRGCKVALPFALGVSLAWSLHQWWTS